MSVNVHKLLRGVYGVNTLIYRAWAGNWTCFARSRMQMEILIFDFGKGGGILFEVRLNLIRHLRAEAQRARRNTVFFLHLCLLCAFARAIPFGEFPRGGTTGLPNKSLMIGTNWRPPSPTGHGAMIGFSPHVNRLPCRGGIRCCCESSSICPAAVPSLPPEARRSAPGAG
jgi:hypothetical protein